MTETASLVWIGAAATVAAVLQLRRAWSLPCRSAAANGIGWALMLVGAALALAGDGAWGLAVASLFGMTAAALLLAHAGWTAPASKARASDRKAHMLPEAGEPRHLGRRLLTFLLTVPLAFTASLLAALGARALAGLAGWSDADGNAMTLLLLPLLWGILAFALIMLPRRRSQYGLLAIPAAAGLGLIFIGGAL
ncbi:hypothetical protein [Sphingopyxis terrae]|uniref:Uncharacterized protein n=1 Tax=Sphingopyxis terrae subsp. ummariensis TaxID=429001 RepID=A0A1Y6FNA4_9SPHN|nr:hypothetical protein [Sphingopyxis terrae]PCF90940.1 hypothetical protein CPA46_10790 [Sphingopyxis terrae subsp. ummariensis]SMQ76448.1 hypothetical protein SAMN06295984_1888 [Sphingopyxis terrae subsp. ummariensis]